MDYSAFDAEIDKVEMSDYGLNIIHFKERVTAIGEEAFSNCTNLFNIAFPNSVKSIGKRAFYGCTNLECISFGTGIRKCAAFAFDGCDNLHSVHIPSVYVWCSISFENQSANPASIYYTTFLVDGEKIKTLYVPDNITKLHAYAFYRNTELESVQLPRTITSIGAGAFDECDKLKKVIIEDLNAWCAIDFGSESANPLSTAEGLYLNNAIVSNLSLDNVEEIKERAFICYSSLRTVTLGDATKKIGLEAFRGCTELNSVSLGSGVEEIGERAFMGCRDLAEVSCLATTPPMLGDGYVFDYNAENRKFYVPSEALEAYKKSGAWSEYADNIEALN
jgi:hypothetical protein